MDYSNFSISGYSTALFSTWYFIEELGVLFDAGDGLTSSLLQKSRKIKHAFISHADRDHLTGLLQFNQLNAREGFPVIYYPENSGSFTALNDFTQKFDPHVRGTVWMPIKEKQEFQIKDRFLVQSLRNNHIQVAKEFTKSLSYKVIERKHKLKDEFKKLDGKEIEDIVKIKGRAFITNQVDECIIGYSGDTPVDNYENWNNTKILIHESTFINGEDGKTANVNKHSTLEEVMKMIAEIKVEIVVLGHFSSRYSQEQIDEAIIRYSKAFGIKTPIFRVLPGETNFNILGSNPINPTV